MPKLIPNQIIKLNRGRNAGPLYWCALLSALLLIPAFPPLNQGYFAWFALLPLLLAICRAAPLQALKAGLLFGIFFNLYVNFYLTEVLFTYLSRPLAILAMVLLIAYISLFYALFGLAVNLTVKLKRPWLTALAVPTFWLIAEFIRSVGFLGYNVGYIGYTQWHYSAMLNLAATYGYWGLPFVIVLFQTLALMCFTKELKGKHLTFMIVVFLVICAGGLIIPELSAIEEDLEPLQVTMIQGNTSPEQIMVDRGALINKYLKLTEAAVRTNTDLVIWPETIVNLRGGENKLHPEELIQTAGELQVEMVYGAQFRDEELLYNTIAHYNPAGQDSPLYHKIRLVPFVEYFPAEKLLNRILSLDLLLGSYTAGEEIIIFEIKGKTVGGVICFESYFGDLMRLFAIGGADHFFVLTNDAWFGQSIGLDQHAQVAAIRAAELGRGVTQVANSGITISFDYRGRELFRTAKAEEAVVTASLPFTKRQTPYLKYGNFFPLFWALCLLLSLVLIYCFPFTRKAP